MSTNNQSHQTNRPAEALGIMTRLRVDVGLLEVVCRQNSWSNSILLIWKSGTKLQGTRRPQQRSAATWRGGSLHFVIPSREQRETVVGIQHDVSEAASAGRDR